MAADHAEATDPLLARADRAIAASVALRAAVRAGLATAAGRRRPFRAWSDHWRPAPIARLAPVEAGAFFGGIGSPNARATGGGHGTA